MKYYLTILFLCLILSTKGQKLDSIRHNVIDYAESYLFVRETAYNRSTEIDSFNTAVKVPVGSSWCASYASWIFNHFKIPNPSSAWSPNWGLQSDRIWKYKSNNKIKIKPGDVFTVYYSNLGRIGHTGIITKVTDDYIYTIEGNTNGSGSREGDGVYKKKRDLNKIYAITRYIK